MSTSSYSGCPTAPPPSYANSASSRDLMMNIPTNAASPTSLPPPYSTFNSDADYLTLPTQVYEDYMRTNGPAYYNSPFIHDIDFRPETIDEATERLSKMVDEREQVLRQQLADMEQVQRPSFGHAQLPSQSLNGRHWNASEAWKLPTTMDTPEAGYLAEPAKHVTAMFDAKTWLQTTMEAPEAGYLAEPAEYVTAMDDAKAWKLPVTMQKPEAGYLGEPAHYVMVFDDADCNVKAKHRSKKTKAGEHKKKKGCCTFGKVGEKYNKIKDACRKLKKEAKDYYRSDGGIRLREVVQLSVGAGVMVIIVLICAL